jgi:hypothetical protein
MNDNTSIFQAIGVVSGKIAFAKDTNKGYDVANIEIGEKQYNLVGKPRQMMALKQHTKNHGSIQRLVVYPKISHYPERDKDYRVAFQLVAFNNHLLLDDLADLEFKLSGLWQFIPCCRVPCISVFKNFSDNRLEFIKQAELERKVKFMKASHVPLLWKDTILPAFKFNPKLPKETDQGKPLFFSLKARFMPDKDVFSFLALTAPPLEESPKFLKASKKDKAEVQKAKKSARPVKKVVPSIKPKKQKAKVK